MIRKGLYAGSFDPLTLGHVDIIQRASHLVDELVIVVGKNAGKVPLFTADERLAMINTYLESADVSSDCRVSALLFDGLTIDCAREQKASLLIRGLRNSTDLSSETAMAGMNYDLNNHIETLFLVSRPDVSHINATLVRDIHRAGGAVAPFIPNSIEPYLKAKQA